VQAQGWRATFNRLDGLLGPAGELLVVIAAAALVVALFLPWYGLALPLEGLNEGGRPRLDEPTGWEAFGTADVVLAVMAAGGFASVAAARAFAARAPYVVAAHAGWFGVVVVLYSYYRPQIVGVGAFPGPPAGGFFLALWAAGAMTGGALAALVARPPGGPPPTA
jgi:hypothetical protein